MAIQRQALLAFELHGGELQMSVLRSGSLYCEETKVSV
jgi:hypothetical protein